GNASPQLHPDYRHLEAEMVAWAGEHIRTAPTDGTPPRTDIFVYEHDTWRLSVLQEQGYTRWDEWAVVRRLRFGQKVIPAVRMPAGYTLRSANRDDPAEHDQFAALLNAAFN